MVIKEEHKFFIDFQEKMYNQWGYTMDKLQAQSYWWRTDKKTGLIEYHNTLSHAYYLHYAKYLHSKRFEVKKVLEIGIFKGHSMLLWNDYFPNAEIYGIDIDLNQTNIGKTPKDICKGKDRIKLFEFDCSKKENVDNFIKEVGGDFDLIIDDGSHHPTHQVLALLYYLPYLKDNGLFVMEDIIKEENTEWVQREEDIFKLFNEQNGVKGNEISYFKDFLDGLENDNSLKRFGISDEIDRSVLKSIDNVKVYEPLETKIFGLEYTQKGLYQIGFITKKQNQ